MRVHASDPRWRVREGVAIALQRVGDRSVDTLFRVVQSWAAGRPYLQRAAIAAVCEPRLLKEPAASSRAVELVDRVTATVAKASNRRSDEFGALRQALGYCWSVAVAANPRQGKAAFGRWAQSSDPDVRWIFAENLKKARLRKADPAWAARLAGRLRP